MQPAETTSAPPSLLRDYLSTVLPGVDTSVLSVETVAFLASLDVVSSALPAGAMAQLAEQRDQARLIRMVAGENASSAAVMLAAAGWLNDRSAEGLPASRLFPHCHNVDTIEQLAIDLAGTVFGADHAYVQPHSGADANLIAYAAVLHERVEHPFLAERGVGHVDDLVHDDWLCLRQRVNDQVLLGMAFDSGGHLTHGTRRNISGRMFRAYAYGVDPHSGRLDYGAVAEAARMCKPLILVAGYSSYPRALNYRILKEIASDVGATLIVDMAHIAGLVAGKHLTGDLDPVPFADIVTTTTHKTLRGPRGGLVLSTAEYAKAVDRGCPSVLSAPIPQALLAKAVCLAEASTGDFREYAGRTVRNAVTFAARLRDAGIDVITGGTDNHIVLVDVRRKGLTGRQAEGALVDVGITCNRNAIPGDPLPPWYASGIRFGTAVVTSMGFDEPEVTELASVVADVLNATSAAAPVRVGFRTDEQCATRARDRVTELVGRFDRLLDLDGDVSLAVDDQRR